jgi:hypothetical protein
VLMASEEQEANLGGGGCTMNIHVQCTVGS